MFLRTLLKLATLTSLATSSALLSQLKHFSGPIGGEVAAREPAPNTTAHVLAARQDQTYSVYCGCGITLDATYTNNIVSNIAGRDWNIPPNTGWGIIQGDVLGFICNYGPTEVYGFQGSQYQELVQHMVSPVCGSFIAGTWDNQYGSSFDAIFGG
jgi:uncharacterized protein (DUF697 family)